ncbi:MAG: winged helix-turn-helix transcriptional regulator [Oscillospiraceae bacterium]|nr:winged helix-turn-helix transcriptional regulator [Oscillospiraceae bacterium]
MCDLTANEIQTEKRQPISFYRTDRVYSWSKVEYNLSATGETIVPVLQSMCDWGKNYLDKREQSK